MRSPLAARAMNLAGTVEHPESSGFPYEIDHDGHPYVPTGTCGVVLGVQVGDRVDALDADQVAPGVTVVHPDPAARHMLTALSCIGNPAVIRSGAAAGARGVVAGKRGDAGRVVVHFAQDVLARLSPGDQISIRAFGQGATGPVDGVTALNLDPAMAAALPLTTDADRLSAGVRLRVASQVCGSGIGRPAHSWSVDLTLAHDPETLARLRFGDMVAVDDLDARTNLGYRAGWCSVGVIVHGPSRRPGHGVGLVVVLTGPADRLRAQVEHDHVGVTVERLEACAGAGMPEGSQGGTAT